MLTKEQEELAIKYYFYSFSYLKFVSLSSCITGVKASPIPEECDFDVLAFFPSTMPDISQQLGLVQYINIVQRVHTLLDTKNDKSKKVLAILNPYNAVICESVLKMFGFKKLVTVNNYAKPIDLYSLDWKDYKVPDIVSFCQQFVKKQTDHCTKIGGSW